MHANLEQAIAYIRQHGSPLELARLHAALGEHAEIEAARQQVAALQNPDGGWPYRQQEGQPSSLAATHHALTWLAELGLRGAPTAQRGLDYLIANQQPDGSWRESEQILRLQPPAWMSPENAAANAYLTADSAYHLAVGRDAQMDAVTNACNYLYQLELEEQFPQTVWIMGALFTIAEGEESEVARATRDYLEARLDSDWGAGSLAWLLNTYLNAGIAPSMLLLAHARSLLESAQQPNGSFASDDGDPFTLDVTIQAVRALQAAGVAE
jgi:hypothetical protein